MARASHGMAAPEYGRQRGSGNAGAAGIGAGSAEPGAGPLAASLAVPLHLLLSAAFLFYVFVGTTPFPSVSLAARVDGNPLDRLFVLGMAAIALPVLLLNLRGLAQVVFSAAGIWIVVAMATLSIFWSDYPGLTLRRSIVLVCLTVAAAGVAAGLRDLRKAHGVFCYVLAGVIALNLAAIVLVPSMAMSDIGAKGWYSQKNVAGMVAMTAVLAHFTWLARGRVSAGQFVLGLLMATLSVGFLLLTRSKTSIGLTVLALAIIGAVAVAVRGGPAVTLAGIFLALCAIAGSLVFLLLNDFDLTAMLGLVLGDTSFTGRDELWAFAFRTAMERPWLGHGYGAFWDVGIGGDPLLRMDPGSWLGDVEPGIINQAHNGYLELWIHLGLPLMLVAVLVVVAMAVRAVFYCVVARPGNRAAFVFLAIMPFVYLVHNLTEASLFMRGIFLHNIITLLLFVIARAPALNRAQV